MSKADSRHTFADWFDTCRWLQQELAEVNQKFIALEQQIDGHWSEWYAKAPASTRRILGPDNYRRMVWPNRREILAKQAAPEALRRRRSYLKQRLKLAEHAMQRRALREGMELV